MEANVYEKPLTLAHHSTQDFTIISSAAGMMVLSKLLCARASWSEVRLTCQDLSQYVLELQNAWLVINDDDAAQVQYHLDTYAPQASQKPRDF